MIVAIHQLHYLPWLRYVHKMASCDAFVVLDDIQFNKNGWQNRNKIKGPQGPQLLTVPVQHKMGQRLDEVKIDNRSAWRRKHWQSLVACYGRAPFFGAYKADYQALYEKDWDSLNALNKELLHILMRQLGISTKILYSSDMGIGSEATQRLVDICLSLRATTYLTGEHAAATYLDAAAFEQAGLRLSHQQYQCPTYTQQFERQGFVPELSIVDLLFTHGPDALNILMGKNQQETFVDTPFPSHAG